MFLNIKKDLHDPDNNDGVITHQEPDIVECEVKCPLEEGLATHSRILAWRILWTEEPGG